MAAKCTVTLAGAALLGAGPRRLRRSSSCPTGHGHGSEVREMVAAGRLADVRAYCESDVLNLFVLYVRWAFITGRIDAPGHNAALDSLVAYLDRERASRPHLGAFLDGWRSSDRPRPMHVPLPPEPRLVVPPDEGVHLRSEDMLTTAITGGE
jgi:hypothetical protein